MRYFFILLFLLSFRLGYSQDYSTVDSIVKLYPRYTKPQKLATRIANDFSNDTEKVRAIFKWLTLNIRYDLEKYYQPQASIQFNYSTEEEKQRKLQQITDKLVNKAFLTKMGVCEEYAQSFKKVADLLHIEALVIDGYVRNAAGEIGKVPSNSNHAWNAVRLDGKWIFLDATWSAGYVNNGRWRKDFNEYFFAMDPKKMSKTLLIPNILV